MIDNNNMIVVGDITIGYSSESTWQVNDFGPQYDKFILNKLDTQHNKCDISLIAHHQERPVLSDLSLIFDNHPLWKIYREDSYHFFPYDETFPGWWIRATSNFKKIRLYYDKNRALTQEDLYQRINPFAYPIDMALVMHYLSCNNGFIVHAAGAVRNGKGYVFPGVSGAGKSTLTSCFIKNRDFTFLSDDRIIIRNVDNEFRMYGTPWHGDAKIASPEGCPLEGIYLLKQSRENRIVRLSPKDVLNGLIPMLSIPWYDDSVVAAQLELAGLLVTEHVGYELQSKPGKAIMDVFINHIDGDGNY